VQKQAKSNKGKGKMQALYGVAMLFPIAMMVLWFMKTFMEGEFSYHSVYMAAGATENIWKIVGYAAIGVIGLNILLHLLPTFGAGSKSRVFAVIGLLLTLVALLAGGYILFEYLQAGFTLKEIPILALAFLGAGVVGLIFDIIVIANGGNK
jgi:hypothetical protein